MPLESAFFVKSWTCPLFVFLDCSRNAPACSKSVLSLHEQLKRVPLIPNHSAPIHSNGV